MMNLMRLPRRSCQMCARRQFGPRMRSASRSRASAAPACAIDETGDDERSVMPLDRRNDRNQYCNNCCVHSDRQRHRERTTTARVAVAASLVRVSKKSAVHVCAPTARGESGNQDAIVREENPIVIAEASLTREGLIGSVATVRFPGFVRRMLRRPLTVAGQRRILAGFPESVGFQITRRGEGVNTSASHAKGHESGFVSLMLEIRFGFDINFIQRL